MRSKQRQSVTQIWPVSTGPLVVLSRMFFFGQDLMNEANRKLAAHESAYSRDGPLIFHMRDGPPNVTGPPGGTGPPLFTSGSAPPKITGPPMEWLVRKKTLKRS